MRVLVLDANNVCQIVRHAYGQNLSYKEELTGVMWGFFNTVLRLAQKFDTNRFLFAFDSRNSYRRLFYDEYRANRRQGLTPEDKRVNTQVYKQIDTLRDDLLPRVGFRNIYRLSGWEADDIIAVLVGNSIKASGGDQYMVVSTDKDLYQLLDACDIYRPLPGENREIITAADFRVRYGISPRQWVEARALIGDVSDNIIGVRGIGEKTAIRWLKGHLKVTSEAYKKISDPNAQALWERNKALMTLPYEKLPPSPKGIFNVMKDGPFSLKEFLSMCDEYGFQSFLKPDVTMEWQSVFGLE